LYSASLLLGNQNSQQYALGLYVYAIEEYGKAILLKRYITENKDKYQIPGWIFGAKFVIEHIHEDSILMNLLSRLVGYPGRISSHYVKLLVGSDNLPPECSLIPPGIRLWTPSPSGKTVNLKSGSKIAPIKGTTGTFTDISHTSYHAKRGTFLDLGLKESCFYMDWDEDDRTWKYDVATDPNKLKENIKYFEETLSSFDCTEN
jgi:hypothetical protein